MAVNELKVQKQTKTNTALQKFPLLGLLLVLTILVSSATADGHVCPPSTKLSRRCNNDKENVVVSFFHRYKVISEYPVSIKYLLMFFVFVFYFLFVDNQEPMDYWSIIPLGRGPKNLLVFSILFILIFIYYDIGHLSISFGIIYVNM
ncbi:putative beta-glucosidase [Arabidopsis thaliana]